MNIDSDKETPDTNLDTVQNGSEMRAPSISVATLIWPLLLGLSAVLVIGYFTFEPDMFLRTAQALNPWIMIGALATVGLRILMGGLRLSYVSHDKLSFLGGIKGQLAWDFASNITPSLVGGAPMAAYYIAKSNRVDDRAPIRIGEVTAFMMFILLLDQAWFTLSVPVLLIAAVFMEVIPSSAGAVGSYTASTYFILFMVWTVLFGYATLYRPQLLGKIADGICRIWFLRRFRSRVRQEMEEYKERAKRLRSQPVSFFVRGLTLTGMTWFSRYLLVVFIVWSVFPDVNHLLLFMRSIAMTISALILPTPGGAGGVEALYALYYTSMMPTIFLAPTLLIWRFLGYYIFLGIGVIMSTHHVHKSIRKRKKKAVFGIGADRQFADSEEQTIEEVSD